MASRCGEPLVIGIAPTLGNRQTFRGFVGVAGTRGQPGGAAGAEWRVAMGSGRRRVAQAIAVKRKGVLTLLSQRSTSLRGRPTASGGTVGERWSTTSPRKGLVTPSHHAVEASKRHVVDSHGWATDSVSIPRHVRGRATGVLRGGERQHWLRIILGPNGKALGTFRRRNQLVEYKVLTATRRRPPFGASIRESRADDEQLRREGGVRRAFTAASVGRA